MMRYQLKVKTGFYKTELYYLKILNNMLIFEPVESSSHFFKFNKEEILSIVILNNKHTKITLNTKNKTIEGIFTERFDLMTFQQVLKESIHLTIIIEEGL